MQLESIFSKNSYIYAERYLNNFKKVSNEVSPEYCAIQGMPKINLPYTLISRKDAKIYLSYPSRKVYNKVIGKKIKFFIHPDMIYEIKPKNLHWEKFAEPTSSTRTLLLEKDFFVKLHLNKRLSRFIRRLRKDSVVHSLAISSEIENSIRNAPKTFAYLPESIGVTYKNFGMIIRELTPRPFLKNKGHLIPLFSLYSPDLKQKDHKPIFIQMIKSRKENPLKVFLDEIINPLFSHISFFIENRGILLEPHGQNVLVELNNQLEITRLVHRDFQSIYIDQEIRNKLGLSKISEKHIMGKECIKEISYSLVFDNYIGRYLLDNFIKLISENYKIPKRKINSKIKDLFDKNFNPELFPKKSFYLMDKSEFRDNKTLFVKINKKPRYRQ